MIISLLNDSALERLSTYSCLVLPRRVVFSFWEVTA